MKDEYKNIQLINNVGEHRFEMNVGEQIVFIEYKKGNKKIWLIHTETPQPLQGQGAATAIIEKTFNYLENNNYRLIPLCRFVVDYLKHHPEWQRMLYENINTN